MTCCPEGRRGSVAEGRCVRSHSTRYRLLMAGLGRSAWNKPHTNKTRPVGHGMIGWRPNPKGARVSSGRLITPIIESVQIPARITPYPTGRLFAVALSQALRARLRSDRPSGTGGQSPLRLRPGPGWTILRLFPGVAGTGAGSTG